MKIVPASKWTGGLTVARDKPWPWEPDYTIKGRKKLEALIHQHWPGITPLLVQELAGRLIKANAVFYDDDFCWSPNEPSDQRLAILCRAAME